ncbi:conserved hypothetical protein [Candidatus Zixiibacteriota bacterium]|nr:conserved hypothetical protein [candidate division Zixibacteria bacterium]
MAVKNHTKSAVEADELVLSRTFDAPPEMVFRAWTEPDYLTRWWGPKMFTCPTAKVDLRVGGKYLICMRGPDGKDYWSTGVYREIVPKKKIVCTDSFADEKGNVVPSTHYGMSPEMPMEMLVTVAFEAAKGKTKFTLHHAGIANMSDIDRKNMNQGWNEMLDKLENLVRG